MGGVAQNGQELGGEHLTRHGAWGWAGSQGSFPKCQGFPGVFHFIPPQPQEVSAMSEPLLQVRKLRLTEVK